MDERQQGASAPSAAGASASTTATVTPWQGQGSRPLANEVPANQMNQASSKTAAPITPLASSSSSSSLAAAMPSPSARTDMPSPSMMPPASTTSSSNGNGQKPKGAPEKRVLPARLRRVSALLGGESLDDANSPGGREESREYMPIASSSTDVKAHFLLTPFSQPSNAACQTLRSSSFQRGTKMQSEHMRRQQTRKVWTASTSFRTPRWS